MNLRGLFPLPKHEFSRHIDADFVGEGAEGAVGVFELLADRDPLGTVLLAFAAADAYTAKSLSVREPASVSDAIRTFSSTISTEFMPESTTVTSGWL